MSFVPRHPVIQNQFCTHDNSVESTANAGAVVYLSGTDSANMRGKVATVSGASQRPFGFLTQKVKAASSEMPTGYMFPGDLGSSDAYAGDPVGVAHLGIWDTTNYVLDAGETTFSAGARLYADRTPTNKGKVVNGTSSDVADDGGGSTAMVVAEVVVGLSAAQVAAGTALRIKLLI